MGKCEKFNKTFRKKIKKSIKYSDAVGNRIYNMEYIHILRKLFALFLSFIVAYLFAKMDAGKVRPILLCRINRENMFWIFFWYFIVSRITEPGTVKRGEVVSQIVFSQIKCMHC